MVRIAAALIAAASSAAVAQSIVAGPFKNPTNGHRYYLVEADRWADAEALAVSMGAHLATINDAAENEWIRANVGNWNGQWRKPFIGLSDTAIEGTFQWADGLALGYTNWLPGEPDNSAARDYVLMGSPDGRWQCISDNYSPYAIIETSRPILVPQEAPTVADAFALAAATSTYDVLIAPGVYPVNGIASTVPAGAGPGRLRGSGLASTRIDLQTTGTVELRGDWIVEDLALSQPHSGTTGLDLFFGSSVVRRCHLMAQWYWTSAPLHVLASEVRVESCRLEGGFAGLYMTGGDSSEVALSNCSIRGATRAVTSHGSAASLLNCTLAQIGSSQSAVLHGTYSSLAVVNSIVWGGAANRMVDGDQRISVSFSVVPAGTPGEGNLHVDPRLHADWLTLRPDSPCIDAADGTAYSGGIADAAGLDRTVDAPDVPNAGRGTPPIDMGCTEFQPPPACAGDFNRDGALNIFDFLAFQTAFGNAC